MEAEPSPAAADPAGPLEPQAARLTERAAAEIAIATERNFRVVI
jgi:hypothetical protein